MTIYDFAPARLTERGQQRLRALVAILTVAAISTGMAISWPNTSARWVSIVLIVLAVALCATFSYRVSSIDHLFAFGLTASILATLGPFTNPVFATTAWSLGVFVGHWVLHKSFLIAAESTLCMMLAAIALVSTWTAVDAVVSPLADSAQGPIALVLGFHLPQIVAAILAFYLARIIVSSIRALVLTRLTLTEILLRVSWPRVGTMLIAELLVASAVSAGSIILNRVLFEDEAPFARTAVIVLISTAVFGLASQRQARTARQRLSSMVEATSSLPWPTNAPVHEQAVAYAKRALPAYEISACEEVVATAKDHIRSVPIFDDSVSTSLVAVRKAGQPPFRVEDLRVLTAIAEVANETIRGRKEVHRLRRLANTDRLTGLLNYRAFQIALDELSEDHSPDNFVALIFIDIDNFKTINDTHGHEAGNDVLKVVADRIRRVIADPSVVARVGGDEFVVLLQHLQTHADAENVRNALQAEVGQPIRLGAELISLRISQGIAYSTPGQQDLSPLVELADRRMYESRGNHLKPAESLDQLGQKPTKESGLVLALHEGIIQRRLQLVFQPIVDLRTARVTALEGLMRYTDPEHGPVPVELILNEAERFGLLPEVSEHLLNLSIESFERARQRLPELRRIHLNVSLEQVLDSSFTGRVHEMSTTHNDLELVLEINERSLRSPDQQAIERVDAFAKKSSAMLAIDDIGQAYTGLGSLRDFPFAIWKVDKNVVRHFAHPRTQALVKALLTAADDLGAELIFEGVETEAQSDWLMKQGAHFGQGYLYGRPVTIDELILRFEAVGAAARL